jgi:hypothetical protein
MNSLVAAPPFLMRARLSPSATAALLALLLFVVSGQVCGQATVLEITRAVVASGLTDESNGDSALAQKICLAGHRSTMECPSYVSVGQALCLSKGRSSLDCPSYTSIGQGLCLIGGRSTLDCPSYTTIGQGVCLSSGKSSLDCPSYVSPATGLCLAKGQDFGTCSGISLAGAMSVEIRDIDWAWDGFYDARGNLQWRCRGMNTGAFADDYRCASRLRTDATWPGN